MGTMDDQRQEAVNIARLASSDTATIANNASLSDAVTLGAYRATALLMPAGWTAASITFQVSVDGTNYYNLYDAAGNEKTITVSTSRAVYLPTDDFLGFKYMKIRSGTAGSPVTQLAERLVIVVSA